MTTSRIAALLASGSLVALASYTAMAQQGAPGSAGGLEEIVVTARRVEENIQKVPIAITAFTPERLEQKDIRTTFDLERSVPGLSFSGFRDNPLFGWVRGVPGIIGYFAEIPSSMVGSGAYFDLGNVQVLKGPQGTLFGLSTNGGAILFTPQKPTDRLEGYVQGAFGSHSRRQGEAVLNVPIVQDKVLLRVGGMISKIDGWLYDPSQNKDLADENYKIARASLTVKPTEAISNYLLINYYQSDNNNYPLGFPSLLNPAGASRLIFGATIDQLFQQQQLLGRYRLVGTSSNGTYAHQKQWNIVDHLAWVIGDGLTVRNLFGYQAYRRFERNDLDALPLPIIDTGVGATVAPAYAPDFTEELQLQGRMLDNRLSFTVGSFNRWNQNSAAPGYNSVFGGINGTVTKTKGKTNALYAQGTYDLDALLAGLSFTGGFRYSWEKRYQDSTNLNAAGVPLAYNAVSAKWTSPSYTLSLSYQVTPDTLLFVTNSKGFSSGGFNATAPAALRVFDPETLNNFEAGIKSEWQLGGNVQARTNVSGYYGLYRSIQVPVTQIVQTPNGPTLSVVTQNAATGHIEGIDAEATLIPLPGLEIGGNLALLRARYDRYVSNGVDLSSTKFVFTPKYKYGVNIRYTLPLDASIGEVSVAADYVKQASVVATARPQPQVWDITPGNDNLNINVSWQGVLGRDGLSATVFVYNVTQNQYAPNQLGTYDTLGILGLGVAVPRMWGIRVKYAF